MIIEVMFVRNFMIIIFGY